MDTPILLPEGDDDMPPVPDALPPPRHARRHGGRPPKVQSSSEQETDIETAQSIVLDPDQPAAELRGASRAEIDTLEVDEWLQTFDWQVPGMLCYAKRLAPAYYKGVPVSGVLLKKPSPITIDEVQTRFGGGEFDIIVYGPSRREGKGRFSVMAKRRITIPGVPITDPDALTNEAREAAAARDFVSERPAPQVDFSSLIAAQAEQQQGDPRAMKEMREMHRDVVESLASSAEKRVEAKESAFEERARMMHEQLQAEREERRRLQEEMQTMKNQTEERIRTAANEGGNLLAALLPTLSANSNEHVKMMAMQFEAKEQRLAAQHEMDVKNAHSLHQQQISELRSSHDSSLRNLQMMHDNNTTLLKGQIQNLEAEKAALVRQVEEARRQLDDARGELMKSIMAAKAPSNPLEQVQQFGQLAEGMQMLRGVFGPAEAAGPVEVGDDLENPMMRTGAKLLDKALTALPAITDAFRRGQQPQPQMYAPQPMPQPRPQPQPQAMVPAVAPPAPPRSRIKKSDLVEALAFVDSVLAQGDAATKPEDLARSLSSVAPNDMVQELTRRPPAKVLEQIDKAQLLTGRCATPEGREYLLKLLQALPREG